MRSAVFAAVAVLALMLTPAVGAAQDAAGLPKGPVPYAKLRPKPKPKTHAAAPDGACDSVNRP